MSKEPIWFNKAITTADLVKLIPGTMSSFLDMRWEEVGADFLKMSMPVNERTIQPYGILHGGASCALAETIGSIGSHMLIDPEKYRCVGMEINANHLKSVSTGRVTALARPVHIGGTVHVWDIRIVDEKDNLICISRLTVVIREIC